jgi:hypothetical protein
LAKSGEEPPGAGDCPKQANGRQDPWGAEVREPEGGDSDAEPEDADDSLIPEMCAHFRFHGRRRFRGQFLRRADPASAAALGTLLPGAAFSQDAPRRGGILTAHLGSEQRILNPALRASTGVYLITSLGWNNSYTHQNPGLVSTLLATEDPTVHIRTPADAARAAASLDHALGATGQNPRKGVTHTTGDVADEGPGFAAAGTCWLADGAETEMAEWALRWAREWEEDWWGAWERATALKSHTRAVSLEAFFYALRVSANLRTRTRGRDAPKPRP